MPFAMVCSQNASHCSPVICCHYFQIILDLMLSRTRLSSHSTLFRFFTPTHVLSDTNTRTNTLTYTNTYFTSSHTILSVPCSPLPSLGTGCCYRPESASRVKIYCSFFPRNGRATRSQAKWSITFSGISIVTGWRENGKRATRTSMKSTGCRS